MKKKLVAAVASVCLVAALGVGATLAYYTAESDAKVNTFTIGNVKIDLLEPEWEPENGKDLVPGAEVPKNPMITNTGASDGYFMLEVDGMEEMEAIGFSAMTGKDENKVAGYNTADWVLVDENGAVRTDNPENKLVDGYYVYIGTAPEGSVAAGESTSALFNSIVLSDDAKEVAATKYQIIANYVDANGLFTYKDVNGVVIEANKDRVPNLDTTGAPVVKYTINGVADMTFETYAAAEAYVLENYSSDATFVFDLIVQGYAIQAEEIAFVNNAGAYDWVKQFTGNAN